MKDAELRMSGSTIFIAVCIILALVAVPGAHAGGKKAIAQTAIARMLGRDAARDAATASKALTESRTVYRYVTKKQAAHETARGFSTNSHFTSGTRLGRPISPSTAQGRFGLPQEPQRRMTFRLPASTEVRFNKVIGGRPGYGEITIVKPLPAQAIVKQHTLQ